MVNSSQKHDPRFMRKWLASGAIGSIQTVKIIHSPGISLSQIKRQPTPANPRMLGLPFENPDVVPVTDDLYVKTPEALEALLKTLKEVGYEIKNLREAEDRLERGITVEQMERKGGSLWFASLPDIRKGVCKSCEHYTTVRGIRVHGNKCQNCGAVTYLDYIDGNTIRFEFSDKSERRDGFSPCLTMKVKRFDQEEGTLYLYPEPQETRSLFELSGEKAEVYLKQHSDKWEYVEEDGQRWIKIHYANSFFVEKDAVIEMLESSGHYFNFRIVKVWDGKEYEEYDNLPIPEYTSIYEAWHWAPLPITPDLYNRILSAARMVSDKGYYYQDGRPAFSKVHWERMATFVRHFTQLNADEFDKAWPKFRSSGPGGIEDLAAFCHPNSQVINEPNIGNTLVALGKAIKGEEITDQEVKAAHQGLGDWRNPWRS